MSRGHPIWTFQRRLVRRLFLWGGLSFIVGLLILISSEPFWRGFASQYIAWGAIDVIIAYMLRRTIRMKFDALTPENIDAASIKEAAYVRRLLAISTGLDVLFVLGGLYILYALYTFHDQVWGGIGWGIIAQGGFLLIFDLVHVFLCPKQ